MSSALTAPALPLTTDVDGVIRVGGTRVSLDIVWDAYCSGATAEEIVEQYTTLELPDVYQAIAYCLSAPEELARYLERRRELHEAVKQEVERRCPPHGIRERLLARKAAGNR